MHGKAANAKPGSECVPVGTRMSGNGLENLLAAAVFNRGLASPSRL